jgi:hypothetical protein
MADELTTGEAGQMSPLDHAPDDTMHLTTGGGQAHDRAGKRQAEQRKKVL